MIKKTARVGQIDMDTGELVEGYIAVLQPKKRNGFINGWYAMSHDGTVAMLSAMMDGKLQMKDMHVLYYLLSILDFQNLIQVNQSKAAESLGMNRQNVNRSIKKLTTLEIIEEGQKIGRSRFYRLNPGFAWKGKTKDHQEALKERMSKAGIKVVK